MKNVEHPDYWAIRSGSMLISGKCYCKYNPIESANYWHGDTDGMGFYTMRHKMTPWYNTDGYTEMFVFVFYSPLAFKLVSLHLLKLRDSAWLEEKKDGVPTTSQKYRAYHMLFRQNCRVWKINTDIILVITERCVDIFRRIPRDPRITWVNASPKTRLTLSIYFATTSSNTYCLK